MENERQTNIFMILRIAANAQNLVTENQAGKSILNL